MSEPETPPATSPSPKRRKPRVTQRRALHTCSNHDCDWEGERFARNKQRPCSKCGARVLRPRAGRLATKIKPATVENPNKGLTLKEQRLVKAYADPKSPTFSNGTRSAIKAGYSSKQGNAANQASETLKKPHVRKALLREIHSHGGTLALTGKRLAEGLSAHQTRVFLSKDGKLVYSDDLVDFDQRRKYAELISRFEGALPTPQEQERIALLQIQQTFNLVPPVPDKRKDIEIEGTVEE